MISIFFQGKARPRRVRHPGRAGRIQGAQRHVVVGRRGHGLDHPGQVRQQGGPLLQAGLPPGPTEHQGHRRGLHQLADRVPVRQHPRRQLSGIRVSVPGSTLDVRAADQDPGEAGSGEVSVDLADLLSKPSGNGGGQKLSLCVQGGPSSLRDWQGPGGRRKELPGDLILNYI